MSSGTGDSPRPGTPTGLLSDSLHSSLLPASLLSNSDKESESLSSSSNASDAAVAAAVSAGTPSPVHALASPSQADPEAEDAEDVEEDDRESFEALIQWLSGKVEILPSKIRLYSAQFVRAGVCSVKRLAKRMRRQPDFLQAELGMGIDDADEVSEVLSREGVFEAIRLERQQAQQADEKEVAVPVEVPAVTLLQTRSRAASMQLAAPPQLVSEPLLGAGVGLVSLGSLSLGDALARSRQGTMGSESELPGYLSNPYAYTYTNDQADDGEAAAGSGRPRKHSTYASRKLSDAKLDLLGAEVAELMLALKQAADGEDEVATMEALADICDSLEGSLDKQRSFQVGPFPLCLVRCAVVPCV